MKRKSLCIRLFSLTLLVCILVGMLPMRVAALADPSLPTADPLELVVDYGKMVSISIGFLAKRIHLNGGAKLGSLVGITANTSYSNGQLLTAAPADMGCTSTDTGSNTMSTIYGTLIRTQTLNYTATKIMEGIESIYAVHSLTGISQTYILVEIRIIPASIMYYEAENLGDSISTINTTDYGNTPGSWSLGNDGTGTGGGTQAYARVGNTNYENLTIDKKNIPGTAFFADFDGTGSAYRYSKSPVYGGLDFDAVEYWNGNATDTLKATAGILSLALTEGKDYHYTQTVTKNGTHTTSPLALRPGIDDIFQIRFRMDGCKATTKAQMCLYFSRTVGENINTGSGNHLYYDLKDEDLEKLNNGQYLTITIAAKDCAYYTNSSFVYSVRPYITGIVANAGSTMLIDYIYVGPPSGLILPATHSTGTFLYFSFDSWATKSFYNSSSVYGGVNFSSTSNWHSDSASTGVNGASGLKFNTSNGTVSFTDGDTTGENYNFIQPGAGYDSTVLRYTTTGSDYFRIRFKISNAGTDTSAGIRMEYRKKGSTWKEYATAKSQTFTFSNDTWMEVEFALGLSSGVEIYNIHPTFYNTQGCTFTIDYIYLGPKSLAAPSDNYLFMDFTNTANDWARYMNQGYGTRNLDVKDGWSGNSYSGIDSVGSGVAVLTDKTPNPSGGTESSNGNIIMSLKNINYTPPAVKVYCQIRLKIDIASGAYGNGQDSARATRTRVDFKKVGNNTNHTAQGPTFVLSEVAGKGYFTSTFAMPDTFTSGGNIASMIPMVVGTQGATVTVDYIYIGPAYYGSTSIKPDPTEQANAATKSLYFGFDKDAGDNLRYGGSAYSYNDTYTGLNYDTAGNTGYWSTRDVTNTDTKSFSIDNGKGIVTLTATDQYYGGTYGPFFTTTKTNGNYGMTSDEKSLKYHPQYAEVFKIRFRLNGCTIEKDTIPFLTFLFAGYDGGGEYDDYNDYPYKEARFAITEEFQTVTIALPPEFRNMTLITNLGVRFRNMKSGQIDIDYIYVGPGSLTETYATYGNDSSYGDDPMFSNGKSLKVNGLGVRLDPTQKQLDDKTYTYPKEYTEATFTFTGTGFDIISRTGPDQGAIRVSVYKSLPMTSDKENLVKSVSVDNHGNMTLYQIPVVSIQGLDYGTYHVKIAVNKAASIPLLNYYRGGEFHFDALRIYDTINTKTSTPNTEQQIAINAYRYHNESYPYIKEIRDSLLSVADFESTVLGSYSGSGALFVDGLVYTAPSTPDQSPTEPTVDVDGHIAAKVKDYNKAGPKNEVYLSPGEAVAFRLTLDSTRSNISSIDVGAKSISGDSTTLAAGFVGSASISSDQLKALSIVAENISTSTGMFYPLDISTLPATGDVYLVLYNAHTKTSSDNNILSLTDLKICYNTPPTTGSPEDDNTGDSEIHPNSTELHPPAKRNGTEEILSEPFRFEVDSRTPEAAAVFINSLYETPPAEEEEEYDRIDEAVKIYHSLNLASDISVNYRIPGTGLENYDSLYLEVLESDYEGNGFMGHNIVTLEPELRDGYYCFTLTGLTAVRMMDELEATLYMTKDGKTYQSETDYYSVADYAYAQLGKATVSDSLKALCADLLVYGAKAQLYKGYRTDALADMELTEEQRSYCTDLDTVSFGSNNQQLTDCETPTVSWVGKTLNLGTKVGLNFVVNVAAYEGNTEDLTLRISYTDSEGEEKTSVITAKTAHESIADAYVFAFEDLLAAELRSVLTVAVYVGETQVSNSLIYSADTYGSNKTEALGQVCKALFAYSDSAKAFFTTN